MEQGGPKGARARRRGRRGRRHGGSAGARGGRAGWRGKRIKHNAGSVVGALPWVWGTGWARARAPLRHGWLGGGQQRARFMAGGEESHGIQRASAGHWVGDGVRYGAMKEGGKAMRRLGGPVSGQRAAAALGGLLDHGGARHARQDGFELGHQAAEGRPVLGVWRPAALDQVAHLLRGEQGWAGGTLSVTHPMRA